MGLLKRYGWSRRRYARQTASGYLLPVVIALGLGISTISMVAFRTVVQNSEALNAQTYKMIAREAAEAGIIAAQKCLISPVPGDNRWPLVSNDCTVGGGDPTKVFTSAESGGVYESTFSVAAPQQTTRGGHIGTILTSEGKVSIWGGMKTITSTVRAFVQTANTGQAGLNVQQVSTGPSTACAIATEPDGSDGWPYCWGDNTKGQLGVGYYLGGFYDSTGFSTIPLAVARGLVAPVAEKDQKHFVCNGWQTAFFGCLSMGSYTVTDVYVKPSPGGTSAMQGKTATKVSVGTDHTCAIARDTRYDAKSAKVYCWGMNDYGQLGTRSNGGADPTLLPVAVDTAAQRQEIIPGYCNGYSNPFTGCAFPTGVWVSEVRINHPASALFEKTVVDVMAGNDFTCVKYVEPAAVTNGSAGTTPSAAGALGGKVACWGKNESGQLGINNRTNQNIPNNVEANAAASGLIGKTVKSLAVVKSGATMCATDTDDNAYCWGQNYARQVGNGAATPTYEQIFWACGWTFGDRYPGINTGYDALVPRAVIGGYKFREMSLYDSWTTAVSASAGTTNPDRAFYWGGTTSVGCGVWNAAARRYYPVSPSLVPAVGIASLAPFSSQALGSIVAGNGYEGPFCATVASDRLHCSGIHPAPSDPSVPLNDSGRLAGRTITDLDVGTTGYACTVSRTASTDGRLDCWGKNDQGQLGNRTLTARLSPFPVDTYRPADPSIPSSGLGRPGYVISNVIYF